ncbi:unnamed protein product [Arctia plantaginis]|uniref:Uncharacterized protein n=1 Tax=Arctia plantaginis TaxID=874455 RepID=A0A8S1BHT3_ARCPL|nr:unnamed protein product [Arctia plantaginis]
MNIDESMVIFRTSFRSSSLENEDVSGDDDATKKSMKTTARIAQRKHKKRYTSTELYTTRNTKYEIATTIKKKKRFRNSEKDDHRQKSVGRHLKHHRINKFNSMAQTIHKIPRNVSSNENLQKTDSQSNLSIQDIILHVLKTIQIGGHHVKNKSTEVLSLRLEDIKHKIKKENDFYSFEQKFRQRHSEKTQKELDKKIDVAINYVANKTSHKWQSWIHSVTENDKMNSIKNISNHFLNLDQNFKQRRSTDNELKQVIRSISTIYERKFSDLIDNTNFNQVNNMTGLEKNILNIIYLSDRFITRLFNYIIDDENKDEHKGKDSKTFEIELSDETNTDLNRACMKLDVCRTRKSFTAFVMDFLTILLSLDNNKFEEAFDSLSDVIRRDDFNPAFGQDIDKGLKVNFANADDQNLVHKRSIIAMIKSIFSNRHSPVIVFSDDKISEVNKTLTFIQIINMLDEKVPESEANIKTWNNITRNFLNYEENKDRNIKKTISDFVANMKHVIGELDDKSKYQVVNGFKVLFT